MLADGPVFPLRFLRFSAEPTRRFAGEPTRRFSGEATAVFSLKRLMHSQKGEREKSRTFLTFRAALGDPLRIFPNGRA